MGGAILVQLEPGFPYADMVGESTCDTGLPDPPASGLWVWVDKGSIPMGFDDVDWRGSWRRLTAAELAAMNGEEARDRLMTSESQLRHWNDNAGAVHEQIDAAVVVNREAGYLWVVGDPHVLEKHEGDETAHSCDQWGCGSVGPHILASSRYRGEW